MDTKKLVKINNEKMCGGIDNNKHMNTIFFLRHRNYSLSNILLVEGSGMLILIKKYIILLDALSRIHHFLELINQIILFIQSFYLFKD
jgi:hypothetical protein